jgi:hypothetical protein
MSEFGKQRPMPTKSMRAYVEELIRRRGGRVQVPDEAGVSDLTRTAPHRVGSPDTSRIAGTPGRQATRR